MAGYLQEQTTGSENTFRLPDRKIVHAVLVEAKLKEEFDPFKTAASDEQRLHSVRKELQTHPVVVPDTVDPPPQTPTVKRIPAHVLPGSPLHILHERVAKKLTIPV